MPVSSNQVAQMLAAQNASAINANTYATQVTHQNNPFGGLESRAAGGSFHAMRAGGMAPGVAQMGQGVMDAGLTAGSIGAAFGLAPRYLDPFTTTAHYATQGYRAAGVAGGIGMGALSAGTYLAIGAAANYATQNIIQGVHQQTHMMNTIQSNYGMSGMQTGMGLGTAGQMAQAGLGIADQASRLGMGGMINAGSMTNLIGMGMQSGQFRGVQSVNQFKQRLQSLTVEAVKMADMMNSTIEEAAQQINQIHSQFGISGSGARGMLGSMATAMPMTGMSVGQQMGMAQMGSNLFTSMGLGRAAGASYGLRTAQGIGAASGIGEISRGAVADMGGVGAVTARLSQAGIRGLSGKWGQRLIGAMMTDEGEFDAAMAARIASGQATRAEILRASRSDIFTIGGRRRLAANRNEIIGQFMGQHGAAGVMSGLQTMHAPFSQSGAMTQLSMGLSSREFDMLGSMGAGSGRIRQRLQQAAMEGLRSEVGHGGISQLIDRAVERMVAPVRNRLRRVGRSIGQSITESLDSISRDIAGLPQASPVGAADAAMGHMETAMAGHGDIANRHFGASGSAIAGHGDIANRHFGASGSAIANIGRPAAATMVGGAARALVPNALRHFGSGGDLADLPGMGLGAGAGLGLMAGAVGIGGLAAGGIRAGGTISAVGARGLGRLAGMFGEGYTGLLGFGGRGIARGAASGALWGLRGVGAATRGMGALANIAKGASLPLLGLSVAAEIPTMMRMGGASGAVSGISGQNAELVRRAVGMGLGQMNWGSMVGSDAFRAGLGTPIVGATQGSSDVFGDAADFYGLGSGRHGGGFVRQGHQTQAQTESMLRQISGLSDLRGMAAATGLTTGNLRSELGLAYEQYEREIEGGALRGVSPDEYQARRMEVMRRAMSGRENLAGLGSDTDVARAFYAAGDAETRELGKLRSLLNYAYTEDEGEFKKFRRDSLTGSLQAAFSKFSKDSFGTTTKSVHGGLLASGTLGRTTYQASNAPGYFSKSSEAVKSAALKYVEGLNQSQQHQLAENTGGAVARMKKAVKSMVAGDLSGPSMALATELIGLPSTISTIQQAAAASAYRGREQDVSKYRKRVSGNYRDYLTTGDSLSDIVGALNFQGSSELGKKMHSYLSSGGSPEALQGIRERMRDLAPDEQQELAQELESMANISGNPEATRLASMARSHGSFGARNKKLLKQPGTIKSKLNITASMFGDSNEVRKLLGLRGGEQGKFVRDFVKARGTLPTSTRLQLEQMRTRQLRSMGFKGAASMASKEMSSLGLVFDDKGLQSDEVKQIEASLLEHQGGSSRPQQKLNANMNAFTQQIGLASKAVEGLVTELNKRKGAEPKVDNVPGK